MKSTGIIRKVDQLGRVVVPIELRRTLGVNEKDPLEIYLVDDKIILKNTKRIWPAIYREKYRIKTCRWLTEN